MAPNLRKITLGTDPTEDYYHTLIESPVGTPLQKLLFTLDNKKIRATNRRGDHGVWFQQSYPVNTDEQYHLRFLEGHSLQLEKDGAFSWYVARGDVPLDFSKLQIICRDETAHEKLVDVLEPKRSYIPLTNSSSKGLILGSDGTPISVLLLSQFNQASFPFIQRKYDSTKARFAPLKHPPEGLLYLELQNFHDKPEYAAHFELLEEFNFWKGALEKAKSNL